MRNGAAPSIFVEFDLRSTFAQAHPEKIWIAETCGARSEEEVTTSVASKPRALCQLHRGNIYVIPASPQPREALTLSIVVFLVYFQPALPLNESAVSLVLVDERTEDGLLVFKKHRVTVVPRTCTRSQLLESLDMQR